MAFFHPEDLAQLDVFCPACPWAGKAVDAVCPLDGTVTCPDCGEAVQTVPEHVREFSQAYAGGCRRAYREEKAILGALLGDPEDRTEPEADTPVYVVGKGFSYKVLSKVPSHGLTAKQVQTQSDLMEVGRLACERIARAHEQRLIAAIADQSSQAGADSVVVTLTADNPFTWYARKLEG